MNLSVSGAALEACGNCAGRLTPTCFFRSRIGKKPELLLQKIGWEIYVPLLLLMEYPQIEVGAAQIPWQLDDDHSDMLPVMQTDIMLNYGVKTLIIDAKYYAFTMQTQFDRHSIHSSNLYQIFTYVKNKEYQLADRIHEVSGILLYARTDEDVYPENEYRMSGNRIEVRTLNLNGSFDMIREQLDGIAVKYLLDG